MVGGKLRHDDEGCGAPPLDVELDASDVRDVDLQGDTIGLGHHDQPPVGHRDLCVSRTSRGVDHLARLEQSAKRVVVLQSVQRGVPPLRRLI